MYMLMTSLWIFTGGTPGLLVTSVPSTSTQFLSIQCQGVTSLKGGWMLRDTLKAPVFLQTPPLFLWSIPTLFRNMFLHTVGSYFSYLSPWALFIFLHCYCFSLLPSFSHWLPSFSCLFVFFNIYAQAPTLQDFILLLGSPARCALRCCIYCYR